MTYIPSTKASPTDLNLNSHKLTNVTDGTATADGVNFGQLSNTAQNILINGGMEFWQRGTTFSVLNNPGAYTADRWQALSSSSLTATVSQDSTTVNVSGGTYSCKLDITSAGTGATIFIRQYVENYKDYAGKTVSFSAMVKTSTASKYRLEVNDSLTEAYSSYHSGGGTFEKLTVSFTLSTSAPRFEVRMGGAMGSDAAVVSTGWFDSVMLVVGSQAISFVPKNYQQELAQCQRYFQKIGGNQATEWIATGQAESVVEVNAPLWFMVPMRATPTMTAFAQTSWIIRSTNGSNLASTLIYFSNPSLTSVLLRGDVASGLVAGNASNIVTNSTSAYVTADAEI